MFAVLCSFDSYSRVLDDDVLDAINKLCNK